jgi:hypothetical protein
MSEEIDKHVLRKYEIVSKLGKGVGFPCAALLPSFLFLRRPPPDVSGLVHARLSPFVCSVCVWQGGGRALRARACTRVGV